MDRLGVAGAWMRVFCVTVVVLVAMLAIGCSGQGNSGRQVAAYVGGTDEWQSHEIYEDEISAYTESFRSKNYYEDDYWWATYLSDNDLTAATWRENVIRQLADRILVEEKAQKLGIVPDEDMVRQQIASAKAAAGVADDDMEAWREYLAESGQTPEELEDTYRFSSLEQQVFKAEIDVSGKLSDEMCEDYIRANLADLVVRHYKAVEFSLEDEAGAQACARQLASLSAEEIESQFDEWIDREDSEGVAPYGEGSNAIDLGWDFLVDMDSIDPDMQLRHAMLAAGQLYVEPLKGDDAYRVMYCAEREQFDGELSYARIGSESLKNTIANLSLSAYWASMMQDYLSSLEDSANIQVSEMPEGLPYDIDAQ